MNCRFSRLSRMQISMPAFIEVSRTRLVIRKELVFRISLQSIGIGRDWIDI